MIKINELRVGNWVEDWIDKRNCIIQRPIDLEDFCMMFNYGNHPLPFKPIPLTEEVLLKCGFVKDDFNGSIWKDLQTHYLEFMIMPDGCYPIYASIPEFSSEPEPRVSLNRIQYVHQLQNLYFALTGEELEVKL